MCQERCHWGDQRRIELLKILGYKIIQNGLSRRTILLACFFYGMRQHPGVGDRRDGVDLDVAVGPLSGKHPVSPTNPALAAP